jgi:hypothetical protein
VVLPRTWVVERNLAWIMFGRRHDCERIVQHFEALISWAVITLIPAVSPANLSASHHAERRHRR